MSGRDLPRHLLPVLDLPPQLAVNIQIDLTVLEVRRPVARHRELRVIDFLGGLAVAVVGAVPRALQLRYLSESDVERFFGGSDNRRHGSIRIAETNGRLQP